MWKNVFKLTFPVMVGYLFLGMAFGILCQKQGLEWYWACLMSFMIYAGSMQFVILSMFSGGLHIAELIFVTLSVNARQLFYGLSFIKRYQNMGKYRWYMIFSLTDETYSLMCNMANPTTQQDKRFMFLISLSNQCYWVIGSVAGSLLGSTILFNTTGIDFAMTALFTVILVEQWMATTHHMQIYIAAFCAAISFVCFKANFLLPSLIMVTTILFFMAPYDRKDLNNDE